MNVKDMFPVKTHDFETDLSWGDNASFDPFWEALYRKAFPNMIGMLLCSGDTESQRRGVDRLIYLSNDKVLRIEEKKRREVYPDILLEYLSNDQTGAPGWIEKDLSCDYFAYAFMPTKTAYLFDWPMLKRAWVRYGSEWKSAYYICKAKNVSYYTHSVAVPIQTLRKAVSLSRIIDVSKELPDWSMP